MGDQLDITCVTKAQPFQKIVVKFWYFKTVDW